ncbi:hypothetical protein KJ750_01085 [Patescibacteria group bacterium]|nr:hypothetical protein [Patescibacteria group bacterium]MBU2263242.1 hypothetical protein [Patescibacteria group bacterium]
MKKTKKSEIKEKAAVKIIHPIFQYLKELMKERIIYYCTSFNDKAHVCIFNYLKPGVINDPKKFESWIHVEILTRGGRINKLEQIFRFYYPKNKNWRVQTDGRIEFWSPLGLGKAIETFWERDKSSWEADSDHPWIRTQLDVLKKLIETGRYFNPYKEQATLNPLSELFISIR